MTSRSFKYEKSPGASSYLVPRNFHLSAYVLSLRPTGIPSELP